jgi:hypothetical protein
MIRITDDTYASPKGFISELFCWEIGITHEPLKRKIKNINEIGLHCGQPAR